LEVSPIFWMEVPTMGGWGLQGLKCIEVEVVLNKWGWDLDEEGANLVKTKALDDLHTLVKQGHPGVKVDVVLKHGY
jgi:hypothetical protein